MPHSTAAHELRFVSIPLGEGAQVDICAHSGFVPQRKSSGNPTHKGTATRPSLQREIIHNLVRKTIHLLTLRRLLPWNVPGRGGRTSLEYYPSTKQVCSLTHSSKCPCTKVSKALAQVCGNARPRGTPPNTQASNAQKWWRELSLSEIRR